MTSSPLRVAALLCVLLYTSSLVHAHSWVACTDYRGDRRNYDASFCKGFPRNWQNAGGSTPLFGADTGFNYQAPVSGARPCRDPLNGNYQSGYTEQFPMAQYASGSTVCLAWPSKNHVAATCTNQYIPDTSLKLFAAPTGTSDPSQATFEGTLVRDWTEHQNGVIDFKGFQNCPAFCDNMDKSLCSQCFTVPKNLQVGKVYTFQWYWIFNENTDPYTTCWEAMIVAGDGSASGGSTTGASSGTPATTGAVVIPPPICNGNGGNGNNGNVPNYGDNVIISKAPFSIPRAGTFDVVVAYSASGSRQITVDILDTKTSPTWYGKGVVTVQAGKGTVSVRATTQGNPPVGPNYVLRAWSVDSQYASKSDPWSYELSRNDYKVSVGSTAAVYSAAAANCADASKCEELCGGAANVSICECDIDGNVNIICADTPEPQAVSASSTLDAVFSAVVVAGVAACVMA